ncbi:MAG: hypothetical protein JWO66_1068, partial [Candidatus Eremiobacteraeota bacterium]|nr:hypothetical protein [Candidatus Eremiobacteraeota bacterium]
LRGIADPVDVVRLAGAMEPVA